MSIKSTWGPKRVCGECNRVFDLRDLVDADEWFYGHDCEEGETS